MKNIKRHPLKSKHHLQVSGKYFFVHHTTDGESVSHRFMQMKRPNSVTACLMQEHKRTCIRSTWAINCNELQAVVYASASAVSVLEYFIN